MTDDDEELAELQRLELEARQRELVDIRAVMATKEGRRFVWRMLNKYSGILKGSYAQNPHDMAFNEGMRNVGLRHVQLIDDACRDMHVLMLMEANEVEGLGE